MLNCIQVVFEYHDKSSRSRRYTFRRKAFNSTSKWKGCDGVGNQCVERLVKGAWRQNKASLSLSIWKMWISTRSVWHLGRLEWSRMLRGCERAPVLERTIPSNSFVVSSTSSSRSHLLCTITFHWHVDELYTVFGCLRICLCNLSPVHCLCVSQVWHVVGFRSLHRSIRPQPSTTGWSGR